MLTNSYAVVKGTLSSSGPIARAGGLIGYSMNADFNIVNSYYSVRRASTDASTTLTNAYGFSRSSEQLECPTAPGQSCQGLSTYIGWNASIWEFGNNRTLPTIARIGHLDDDGDGILNRLDNCRFVINPDQNNSDDDPYGNACDAFEETTAEWRDSDADTIGDNADNCVYLANPRQLDYDNDSQGDACDIDIDDDGYNNADDALDYDPHEQDDSDYDGVGDNTDNCPSVANPSQNDLDGDSDGDLCDPDYDNDGIHEILTTFQLNAVRTNLSADYELLANLSLAAYANWQPIGNYGQPFTGTFDGNNHSIRDITSSGYNYVGLFGYIDTATISYLSLAAGPISSAMRFSPIGPLVGQAQNSQISYVEAILVGSITTPVGSSAVRVGGLVGHLEDSNLSYARATIIGNNHDECQHWRCRGWRLGRI